MGPVMFVFKAVLKYDVFLPFNYPQLQPLVRGVFYIETNSVTGWDCTYCLLSLARSHELQHCMHPSPITTAMLREWQKKRRDLEEEEESWKGEGPTFFTSTVLL